MVHIAGQVLFYDVVTCHLPEGTHLLNPIIAAVLNCFQVMWLP